VLAVAVDSSGRPALRELPEPAPPPGGALVDVRLCGLCGSDVEKLRPGGAAPGAVLGHELAGVVVEGPLPAGTRVALAHHVPCGDCPACASGHEPLCPTFAASRLDPGGFCERTAASAAHVAAALLPLPDDVSDLAGTFVEPLACVLRGVEALPARGPALVLGAGSVGLLAAQALRAAGHEPVRVGDPDPARARRAGALGFAAPKPHERFPSVLSTVAAALGAAVGALADAGTLVVFAGGEPQALDVDAVYRRELRLVGVRSAAPRHLRAALAAIQARRIDVEGLVDAVLPLASFDEGVRRYREREALKVVFAP